MRRKLSHGSRRSHAVKGQDLQSASWRLPEQPVEEEMTQRREVVPPPALKHEQRRAFTVTFASDADAAAFASREFELGMHAGPRSSRDLYQILPRLIPA